MNDYGCYEFSRCDSKIMKEYIASRGPQNGSGALGALIRSKRVWPIEDTYPVRFGSSIVYYVSRLGIAEEIFGLHERIEREIKIRKINPQTRLYQKITGLWGLPSGTILGESTESGD